MEDELRHLVNPLLPVSDPSPRRTLSFESLSTPTQVCPLIQLRGRVEGASPLGSGQRAALRTLQAADACDRADTAPRVELGIAEQLRHLQSQVDTLLGALRREQQGNFEELRLEVNAQRNATDRLEAALASSPLGSSPSFRGEEAGQTRDLWDASASILRTDFHSDFGKLSRRVDDFEQRMDHTASLMAAADHATLRKALAESRDALCNARDVLCDAVKDLGSRFEELKEDFMTDRAGTAKCQACVEALCGDTVRLEQALCQERDQRQMDIAEMAARAEGAMAKRRASHAEESVEVEDVVRPIVFGSSSATCNSQISEALEGVRNIKAALPALDAKVSSLAARCSSIEGAQLDSRLSVLEASDFVRRPQRLPSLGVDEPWGAEEGSRPAMICTLIDDIPLSAASPASEPQSTARPALVDQLTEAVKPVALEVAADHVVELASRISREEQEGNLKRAMDSLESALKSLGSLGAKAEPPQCARRLEAAPVQAFGPCQHPPPWHVASQQSMTSRCTFPLMPMLKSRSASSEASLRPSRILSKSPPSSSRQSMPIRNLVTATAPLVMPQSTETANRSPIMTTSPRLEVRTVTPMTAPVFSPLDVPRNISGNVLFTPPGTQVSSARVTIGSARCPALLVEQCPLTSGLPTTPHVTARNTAARTVSPSTRAGSMRVTSYAPTL